MIQRLTEKLELFSKRLDQGRKCTHLILDAVNDCNWDQVEELTNNRERLLNIVAIEQENIEKIINSLIDEELTPKNINLIKSWAFDTQNWINEIAAIDDEVIDKLNQSKDQTTSEIASLFKSKQAFRGYNLNDVRK